MTDKQIIIDGVDVSGCEHRCNTHKTLLADGHIKEFANYCQITNDGCYSIDCYYKQLQAKEQECERLRGEIWAVEENLKDYIEHYNRQCEQLDQLKAELEALKSFEINLVGIKECEIRQLVQYRKTLAEIKEIAEKLKNFYEELGKCEDLTVVRLKQILQKISEVEDEKRKTNKI